MKENELRARLEAEEKMKETELKARLSHEKEMKDRELELQEKLAKEKIAQEKEKLEAEKESKEKSAKLKSLPKLPYFDEKHDDIESYLFRFEKHARNLKWPEPDWPVYLAPLLKGKALTYYQELSPDDAAKYEKLREHLLRRFRCTEEGFRAQFRSVKPESHENMHTFFSRLRRFFCRWLEMADVGQSFEKLCDLLLREQILSSCATGVVTFLRESKFSTAEAMIEAAERYREAHPSQSLAVRQFLVLWNALCQTWVLALVVSNSETDMPGKIVAVIRVVLLNSARMSIFGQE